VHRAALGGLGPDLIAVPEPAKVAPQADPATEKDGCDSNVQLIDETGFEELSNGADATPDAHVVTVERDVEVDSHSHEHVPFKVVVIR
jgi:hypothetical protein